MSRVLEMTAAPRRRSWPTLAAVGVCAFATLIAGVDMRLERAGDCGVFTGEVVAGLPVYRLPAIEVVADRKTEFARIEREEKQERARQARAKAGRPAA